MYNINIKPVLNGWVAEVGCQTLVFDDMDVLLSELEDYLKDPNGTEKKYRETAVNCKITLNGPMAGLGYPAAGMDTPDHPYPPVVNSVPSYDEVRLPASEYAGMMREIDALRAAASQ